MMDIQRWSHPEGSLALNPTGSVVLFSDIEEALKDKDMLEWLLPICTEDGEHVDHRTLALVRAITIGRRGRDAVAFAMNLCPAK